MSVSLIIDFLRERGREMEGDRERQREREKKRVRAFSEQLEGTFYSCLPSSKHFHPGRDLIPLWNTLSFSPSLCSLHLHISLSLSCFPTPRSSSSLIPDLQTSRPPDLQVHPPSGAQKQLHNIVWCSLRLCVYGVHYACESMEGVYGVCLWCVCEPSLRVSHSHMISQSVIVTWSPSLKPLLWLWGEW